jgi:hypothetical protein
MHIMTEPPKIDQRLPNFSLMIGTNGNDRIAPREYAAAMIPAREPCGLSKSIVHLAKFKWEGRINAYSESKKGQFEER